MQALDGTVPIRPMHPGLPEKATQDAVRHGTTTLFVALEVTTGKACGGSPTQETRRRPTRRRDPSYRGLPKAVRRFLAVRSCPVRVGNGLRSVGRIN